MNKELLRIVTSAQLKEYLADPEKKEQIATELIKMAKFFVNKNPLQGIEKEDYVNDLFVEIWKRIEKYDDKRAGFSTFCYWWFKSYAGTYMQKHYNQPRPVSLDMETVSDGSMVLGDSIAEEETYSFADEAQYKEVYALSGPELKMWSEGVSQQDIAKKLDITQAQVSRRITANIKKIRERFGVEDDTAE